jgi:hypothetical protein
MSTIARSSLSANTMSMSTGVEKKIAMAVAGTILYRL